MKPCSDPLKYIMKLGCQGSRAGGRAAEQQSNGSGDVYLGSDTLNKDSVREVGLEDLRKMFI